jgi:hypothetical protein
MAMIVTSWSVGVAITIVSKQFLQSDEVIQASNNRRSCTISFEKT